MTDYLWTIAEINGAIVLLLLVFKLVRNRLSFVQQRFALLSIPVLATAAVLLKKIPVVAETWSYRIPIAVLEPVNLARDPSSPQGGSWLSIETAYWIGVLVLAVLALWKLFRIVRLFVLAGSRKKEGYRISELPGHESFSFFRCIQLKPGLDAHDRAIVLQHEQLHARKLHSLDLLYLEAVHCFAWFNPVLPFLKKELVAAHEFEVDRIMYDRCKAGYMEFLLAYSLGAGSSSYLFTHQFLTQLTLIKRIKTMKNIPKKRWILALALPLAAGALTLVSWTAGRSETAGRPGIRTAQEPVAPETEVDKLPEFRGGNEALANYLIGAINYPGEAVKAGVSGTVIASFVVTKRGKITGVTIKRGVSAAIDAEAERVIAAMPDWIPAEKEGKKVDAEMVLPIVFKL